MLTIPFQSVVDAPGRGAGQLQNADRTQPRPSFANVFSQPSMPVPATERAGQHDAESPVPDDGPGECSDNDPAIDTSPDCGPPMAAEQPVLPTLSPSQGKAVSAAGPPPDQAVEPAAPHQRSETASGSLSAGAALARLGGNEPATRQSATAGAQALAGQCAPAHAPVAGARPERPVQTAPRPNDPKVDAPPPITGRPNLSARADAEGNAGHGGPADSRSRNATQLLSDRLATTVPCETDAIRAPGGLQPSEAGAAMTMPPGPNPPPSELPATLRAALTPGGMREMAEALVRQADGRVEIALAPEELGRVRMALVTSEAGVSVSIGAERPETLALMRRHIEQLASDLRQLGYADVGFSFSGGDQPKTERQLRHDQSDASPESIPELWGRFQPEIALPLANPAGSGLDLRL
ncbi:MAG: flagellar hook-length control protein FliK [Jhaorihella sp.]